MRMLWFILISYWFLVYLSSVCKIESKTDQYVAVANKNRIIAQYDQRVVTRIGETLQISFSMVLYLRQFLDIKD